jgi:DNA-binding NarL/FixJ family response regulator
MHFTYEREKYSATELMQGDVLRRTAALDEVLKEVHPHFYQHPKNLFFMVLTQSCDLVTRGPSNSCKAPYIAIAPVRTLDLVIERYIALQNVAEVKAELPVLSAKARNKVTEFLHRLFNNNEPGYFYLDSADTALPADCAAFLNLSIAIKSELHFTKCIEAKVLQLTDTFQAKLGWLVGEMFSRVGTPDWEAADINRKVTAAVRDAAIWVDDSKINAVEAAYRDIAKGDVNRKMSAAEITSVVSRVPTRKQLVINQANVVIADVLKGNDAQAQKLIRRLESDSALTALLK